jgi:hypothetical protein
MMVVMGSKLLASLVPDKSFKPPRPHQYRVTLVAMMPQIAREGHLEIFDERVEQLQAGPPLLFSLESGQAGNRPLVSCLGSSAARWLELRG